MITEVFLLDVGDKYIDAEYSTTLLAERVRIFIVIYERDSYFVLHKRKLEIAVVCSVNGAMLIEIDRQNLMVAAMIQ